MAADATPGADRSAAPFLRPRLGRSWLIRPLALSGDCPQRVASIVTDQYRWNVSPGGECPLSAAAQFRPAARYPVGRAGYGLSGVAPPPQLYTAGPLGGGLYRSVVIAHRSGPQRGRGVLVWAAGMD